MKVFPTLCFDGGSMSIRASGYGDQDGSGYFAFAEDDLDWQPNEDNAGSTAFVKIARSEWLAIRDFLNAQFAPRAVTDADVERMCQAFDDVFRFERNNGHEAMRAALETLQEPKP